VAARVLPLEGTLVVDLSSGIPGGYCTRILADGGARVVKVESPEGDPLRRWTASGVQLSEGDDGALFQHLSCSKESVVADPARPEDLELVGDLVRGADVVVWSPGGAVAGHPNHDPRALQTVAPGATIVAITPVGLNGPWASKAHTEFTLQAWGGALSARGTPDRPPVAVGGRIGEWTAGMFAAAGALMSRYGTATTGGGDLLDVSIYESIVLSQSMYPITIKLLARTTRVLNFPGIEQTKDGLVGLTVGTADQWQSFCRMVEREDWLADADLLSFTSRFARFAELSKAIESWMSERTTAQVIELGEAARLPITEIGNGANLPHLSQFSQRASYVKNPRSGFLQPDVSYTIGDGSHRRSPEPAPRLGEHTAAARATGPQSARPPRGTTAPLPLEGLRVADFTSAWAGPFLTQQLGSWGADVIRVESTRRLDQLRLMTTSLDAPQWWETSAFAAASTNKRSLTLNMNDEKGRELAERLCGVCDVVIDNFSPRVMEKWGLDYDSLATVNPSIIQVRMPGFGLSGPWRDRVGFAMTAEQASGLAWVTGYPDQAPQVPGAPCDPIGGGHGLIALLLALEVRRRTGKGMLVEAPLVGGALCVSAEQVVEYSAYGHLIERQGNRDASRAPQGLYLTADLLPDGRQDRWVAIAVETETQWQQLIEAIGSPSWAGEAAYATLDGRRAAHDFIDSQLADWCIERSADEIVETLWDANVPTAKVVLQQELDSIPQLDARGWWSTVPHPVTGGDVHNGHPVRIADRTSPIHRRRAPLLGEHNREILTSLLGQSDADCARLELEGVIGTAPQV
jgi:crotonobetainyl-CoA:carnitine CoA-transferase CaiB-like acyl-CoA transferase